MKRGGAFTKGAAFTSIARDLKEKRQQRPVRRAGRKHPRRDRPPTHSLAWQLSNPIPPETLEEKCLRLEKINATLVLQRDDALGTMQRRANVDMTMVKYDQLLKQIEAGYTKLRQVLRTVIQVAES